MNSEIISTFIKAACSRHGAETARERLPAIQPNASADIYLAATLGNYSAINAILASTSALALQKGGPFEAEPLVYLCTSHFFHDRPGEFLQSARLLLEHGANPNATYIHPQFPDNPLSVLYGAMGELNAPPLAQLLLEAGASPDDNESLYHATEHRDHCCMKLLMEFGVKTAGTNALKRMLDFDDLEGERLLLEYGADPNERPGAWSTETALHHAIMRGRGPEAIRMLLAYGANVNAKTGSGKTAYALAIRYGMVDVALELANAGADTGITDIDRFLAACMAADANEAKHQLATTPDMITKLNNEDQRVLARAVSFGMMPQTQLMLELGFGVDLPADWGGSPLHHAAWNGDSAITELLLKYNPDLTLLNDYGGTPLSTSVYASQHSTPESRCCTAEPSYVETIRLLLNAGSEVDTFSAREGSPEVRALMQEHLATQTNQD